MKIKNIVMMTMLSMMTSLILGTELEIINHIKPSQNEHPWVMDVQAEVSLGNKVSDGKPFTNISYGGGIKYNSGIYKIVGLNIRLRQLALNGTGYLYTIGKIKNWPFVDVTNRNARFVLISDGGLLSARLFPNKNNLSIFSDLEFKQSALKYRQTTPDGYEKFAVSIQQDIEEGWTHIEHK